MRRQAPVTPPNCAVLLLECSLPISYALYDTRGCFTGNATEPRDAQFVCVVFICFKHFVYCCCCLHFSQFCKNFPLQIVCAAVAVCRFRWRFRLHFSFCVLFCFCFSVCFCFSCTCLCKFNGMQWQCCLVLYRHFQWGTYMNAVSCRRTPANVSHGMQRAGRQQLQRGKG